MRGIGIPSRVSDPTMLVGMLWVWVISVVVLCIVADSTPGTPPKDDSLTEPPTMTLGEALFGSSACWALSVAPFTIGAGIYGYIKLARLRRAARLKSEPRRCRRCGYLLIGIPLDRCPECATPSDADAELEAALADESRREWARIALASVCVIVTFCAWSAIRPPSSLAPPVVVACIVWWSVHRLARWCVA